MAARPGTLRAPSSTGAKPARRPNLSVLTKKQLAARALRRRTRVLIALAAMLLGGSLLTVAAAQAEVASQQLKIDAANQELNAAVTANGNLELQRAELSAPVRILQISEHKLGMVSPASVTYLAPVKTGPSLAQARPPGQP